MAVSEDGDPREGEDSAKPRAPARYRTGVVNDADAYALELDLFPFGKPVEEVIVVAAHGDEPLRRRQALQEAGRHDVAGVDDGVGTTQVRPCGGRQVRGACRSVCRPKRSENAPRWMPTKRPVRSRPTGCNEEKAEWSEASRASSR